MNLNTITDLCDADAAAKYADIRADRDLYTLDDLRWYYGQGEA
ncbi:MAG: hypothetical protein WA125_16855 [Desulfosporosinus sp.]